MKKYLALLAMASMFAFSCTKENTDPKDDPKKDDPTPKTETIATFTATLQGAGTKTAWAAGDAVIVYAVTEEGDTDAKYVLSAGAGTATATFTAEGTALKSGANAYYACYPYSSIDFAQHNTFSFTLEATQTAANPVFGTTTDGTAFTFGTPLAGIEIKLTGKGNAASIFLEDKNANSILNGNVTFNAKTSKLSIKNSSASKNTVTKTFETVALGTEPTSFFMEVPAGTLSAGANLVVYNPANGMIGTVDIPAQDLKAGTLTVIGPVALTEVSSVADLSANEGANCYMITEPGTYKFKTNKGNSPDNVGVPASAVLLWESYCNNQEVVANSIIAEVSYASDYVTFKTPATLKKGNAVIAVKDAAGVILWSWHIWVVADQKIEGTNLGFDGGSELMNYNLGAVGEPGTPEGLGMLYAWGRKDPFLSLGSFGEEAEIATVSGVAVTNTEEKSPVSEEFAIQNPTVWVLVTGSDGMKDWLTPSDDARWSTVKTANDPCPAGWRVADREENAFFSYDSATKNEEGTIFYVNKTYAFPITSCKAYSSGSVSDDCKYFTCTNGGEYAKAWRLSKNNNESRRKAEGCSIRCIKDVQVVE